MKVYLASAERFWRDLDAVKVRFVLASFYHLRYNALEEMLEYFLRLRESSTPRSPSGVFLDSGIYTFKSGASVIPDAKLQDYADSFISFVSQDNVFECFDHIAEIDYYQDLKGSDGTVLQEAYDRVQGWRDRLYDAVGSKLMPVLVPEMTEKQKIALCKDPRFHWVALASFSGEDHDVINYTRRHINMAHKHGKKIHLFGQTNTQTNFKWFMDADSCDSSTWVGAQRHGMTFIHRRGVMEVIDHSYQFRRGFYANYYRRIGIDYEKVRGTHTEHADFCDGPDSRTKGCDACADQARENRKSALIAWRDFAGFILRRTVPLNQSRAKAKRQWPGAKEKGRRQPPVRARKPSK